MLVMASDANACRGFPLVEEDPCLLVKGCTLSTLEIYLSPFLLSSLLGVTYYPKNCLSWG